MYLYNENALSDETFQRWFHRICSGNFDVKGALHKNQPIMEKNR